MRIGYLGPGAAHFISRLIWNGVRDEALASGNSFVLFATDITVDGWHLPPPDRPPLCYVDSACIDGLVVYSSGIGREPEVPDLEVLCAAVGVPVVSVGYSLPSVASVTVDCGPGLGALVDHLVTDHGVRSPIVVAGPVNHQESKERVQSVRHRLAEHGITLDNNRVFHGNFSETAGRTAITQAVDSLGLQFDAAIGMNDSMAGGVIRELARRGISVPDGCAVVGYDDARWGEVFDPPMTTVRQPFADLGKEAARMMARVCTGESVPNITIPASAVIRRSCGCPQPAEVNPGLRAYHQRHALAVESQFAEEIALLQALDHITSADEIVNSLQAPASELGVRDYCFLKEADSCGGELLAASDRSTPGAEVSAHQFTRTIHELAENAAETDVTVVFPLTFSSGVVGSAVANIEIASIGAADSLGVGVGGLIHRVSLLQELEHRDLQRREAFERLVAAQRRLSDTERLASLGRMAADLAHELNTPIGVATTALSFLKSSLFGDALQEKGTAEDHQTAIELIDKSMRRLVNLVDRVQSVVPNRISSDQDLVDLRVALPAIIETLGPETEDHAVRIECGDIPAVGVMVPLATVSDLLFTFVTNAINHGLQDVTDPVVNIVVRPREDEGVSLIVADNGHGAPQETIDRALEPFFTTARNAGHIGLGLHAAHNSVIGFGGTISLHSSDGQGFRAEVVFPAEVTVYASREK